MPNKKLNKPTDTAAADSEPSAKPNETALDVSSVESEDPQLADLRELTRSLLVAVQAMHAQNTRNEMLRSTIDDVKADVKAAARAMLLSPAASAAAVGAHPGERDDKCSPCDCVSEGCCCFEIVLAKVRAAKPQIEPPDAGDIPLLINAMEVQIYVTVDGIGFLFPGLATTMDLRADGAPGGPGPWVVIERVVNRVYVPKGTTVTTQLTAEVREHDEGVERPIAFKDEIGEASGLITLDCCMSKVFPPLPIDVSLLHGGEGRGMVQVAFYARRVCC